LQNRGPKLQLSLILTRGVIGSHPQTHYFNTLQ
jgi:hypothetical protein